MQNNKTTDYLSRSGIVSTENVGFVSITLSATNPSVFIVSFLQAIDSKSDAVGR